MCLPLSNTFFLCACSWAYSSPSVFLWCVRYCNPNPITSVGWMIWFLIFLLNYCVFVLLFCCCICGIIVFSMFFLNRTINLLTVLGQVLFYPNCLILNCILLWRFLLRYIIVLYHAYIFIFLYFFYWIFLLNFALKWPTRRG